MIPLSIEICKESVLKKTLARYHKDNWNDLNYQGTSVILISPIHSAVSISINASTGIFMNSKSFG
jgi:hypothetical protein